MTAAETRIGPRGATALLLVEGYCSLAVEMIALRVLVPVAGQSVGVTGIVVTAFLAALALGYRSGGRFAGGVREKLGWNLAAAAAWSAFWLSRFGVALAFDATGWMPPLWQVAVYAVLGVGPPAFLLAESVVLLVGSAARATASGKAGGAFSASTLGNVAGGLLTALVVMQHLGVAAAVALVCGLLLLAALGAWDRLDWRLWPAAAAAALACGANLAAERNDYVLATAHADYAVEDADGARHLRVNGQNASREDGAGIGHPYIEWIEDRVYGRALRDGPLRVLVVGAGGFTFGRGRPERLAEIVYVDVDPRLGEAADLFLGSPPRSGTYAAMDGRAYLLRHEEAFDAVVLDAFADRTTMPAHLVTREFFALARSRLAAGGTLYLNLIAPPRPERLAARIERTLRSAFAWCRTHAAGNTARWHNLVFACARSELDGDAAVYSDGGARGETDGPPRVDAGP
ncbi:MAG: fused MFS/spermidine synthase [Gammaproteobacteria bacterium]|nr:fused MFS/spermidine synthase [Gammaproteobacteria bacterium]